MHAPGGTGQTGHVRRAVQNAGLLQGIKDSAVGHHGPEPPS